MPYRWVRTHPAGDLARLYTALPAATRTANSVTIAGRLFRRHRQGGVLFADVVYETGQIQIFADADADDFQGLAVRSSAPGSASPGIWSRRVAENCHCISVPGRSSPVEIGLSPIRGMVSSTCQ